MSKTNAESITGLETLRDRLKSARDLSYKSGTPIVIIIPDLHSADQIIALISDTAADIKKYQSVEREAVEYDRLVKAACAADGKVGREPDGRDYNELYAILSILPPKVNA